MRGLRRPALLVVAASAVVLVLSACGDEDGKALPGSPTAPPPTTHVSTQQPSTPGQGTGQLEAMKACGLLTDTDAASISKGFAVKEEGPVGGSSDTCSWETSVDRGVPIDKHVSVSIALRPQQSVDETNLGLGKATDGDVEGRKAKQVAEDGGEGTCLLAFAAENGRVDILIHAKQTERACEIASDVSTLIEPKLPKPTA